MHKEAENTVSSSVLPLDLHTTSQITGVEQNRNTCGDSQECVWCGKQDMAGDCTQWSGEKQPNTTLGYRTPSTRCLKCKSWLWRKRTSAEVREQEINAPVKHCSTCLQPTFPQNQTNLFFKRLNSLQKYVVLPFLFQHHVSSNKAVGAPDSWSSRTKSPFMWK